MSMKLAMNIPGYIQDSQKEYIDLLDNDYIEEIYLMAPYFSDDRVARTLIKTANKMKDDIYERIEHDVTYNSNIKNKKKIKKTVFLKLKQEKKIHILFPKKQENRIIEE